MSEKRQEFFIEDIDKSTESGKNYDSSSNAKYINLNEVEMPLLPVRGMVVFPYTVVHFDVGREKSLAALNTAMEKEKILFLTTQRNETIEEPEWEHLAISGTVAIVRQVLKLQNGVVRVLVEGLYKARLKDIKSKDPYYISIVSGCEEKFESIEEMKALARHMKKLFSKYIKGMNLPIDNSRIKLSNFMEIEKYTYKVASGTISISDSHQVIMDKQSLRERLEFIIDRLENELKIINFEKELSKKTKEKIDKQQRDYYLKQQLRLIQEELGGKEDLITEINDIMDKVKRLKLPKHAKEKIESEIKKLKGIDSYSPESSNIRTYIDTVLNIPWKKVTKDTIELEKVEMVLEKEHYGLHDVKERILEYLAVRKLNNGLNGPIICLVGPPGVGKTSIARSIANSMNRKFVRMSLGGVRDEAEIRGHRRTYIGSIPGRIIANMKDVGVINPVFLLDEIDKMGSDYKGDPSSAMLEVLDPEQNNTFKDHYLEIEYDLSKVLFITTANSLDTIPRPLLDRMEIIEVSGYTDIEKINIAKKYLVDKQVEEHGIKKELLKISDGALKEIVEGYTRESGVRNLKRQISKICRKATLKFASGDTKKITVDIDNIENYLGPKKYRYDEKSKNDQIGVVMGLAYTQYGGDTLPVEVAVMKGTGKLQLTGKLGDVMQESGKTGYSYIRANAKKYGIDEDFYKKVDIHIHAPEGAIPKDGPSAGVTMITAMVSALSGKPVRGDIAMTGEVTLTGNVLPIGGVKEKSLSAYRAGIKTIILPEENKKDLVKIPSYIKDEINFIFAKKVDVVLGAALRGETNDN